MSSGSIGYTWHLSVINAGMPRNATSAREASDSVWHVATHFDTTRWQPDQMSEGRWLIGINEQGNPVARTQSMLFGLREASPISGDFNGDGKSEIGIFYRGEWFIDLNGNGKWDEGDLWAKLGDEFDRPVVGDWDGDSKDDIGIFGPEWLGDQRHIDREPGLPDSHNDPEKHDPGLRPKNLPPREDDATDGRRLMRLNANGPRRADLIDHVFRYGSQEDSPVSGDWNGDGIRTIGLFRQGVWRIDSNGDGVLDANDQELRFGRMGDIPLVGDWNGNGVEDIGVYRSGTWIIDSNGNRELDVHDKVFELGGATDVPVVGDWDGNGISDPAVFRDVTPLTNVKAP
jgi:hypothetical protein